MRVIKRNQETEPVSFDKILERLTKLTIPTPSNPLDYKYNYPEGINVAKLTQMTIRDIYDGITTEQIDDVSSQLCASLIMTHHNYNNLGAKICISNNHKCTLESFHDTMKLLYNNRDHNDNHYPFVTKDFMDVVTTHRQAIEDMIDYNRDYNRDYFGFKTLEKAYLFKINGKTVERIQHMLMRVSVGIHYNDMEAVKSTYDMMSLKYFTHATPTLFNAGTPRPQLSSCFLMGTHDSLEGIYKTITDSARISKHAGGIGIHISNIRAKGSRIYGTNGTSNGIIPMCCTYNASSRYIDQGGGKRNGSIAMYLEPWHADIMDYLDLKKNTGSETERARDLFLALWVCDEFMRRVEKNETWSLMCPNVSPGLADVHGQEFEALYCKYEQEGKFMRQVPAREVWSKILESQIETGVPYILYKDNVNKTSNQANLGTIRSSNLCAEITEYSNDSETAVCNLASIAVNEFVIPNKDGTYQYDYTMLQKVAGVVCNNLNIIIDINYYPTPECKKSNLQHRPIGIGIQGLADLFFTMRLPFTSPEARTIMKNIHETILFGAMTVSMELAKKHGKYSSFDGSPMSQGKFPFNLWGIDESTLMHNWPALREQILIHGTRNSLLTALMPTASSSQILGNTEAFEPLTTNLYSRRTLAGVFPVVNRYLMQDLIKLNLWDDKMKNELMYHSGSIQAIKTIPDELKELYKTVWEIKQKDLIDMAADRAPMVCQSQSMNLYFAEPSNTKLSSALFHGWRKGLKTGMYYLRSKPASEAIKFTVDESAIDAKTNTTMKCNKEDGACLMCSS